MAEAPAAPLTRPSAARRENLQSLKETRREVGTEVQSRAEIIT